MSSSGINAINSGPLIIRSYLGSSSNNTYALGDNDIPISSNRVLITSTNGLVVLSDNIYVSSITVSSINGGGGGGNDVFWSSTLNSGGIVNTNTGNVFISTALNVDGNILSNNSYTLYNVSSAYGTLSITQSSSAGVGNINCDNLTFRNSNGGTTTNVNVAGTLSTLSIRDNTGSSGTSGYVLTAGTGGQVIWNIPAVSNYPYIWQYSNATNQTLNSDVASGGTWISWDGANYEQPGYTGRLTNSNAVYNVPLDGWYQITFVGTLCGSGTGIPQGGAGCPPTGLPYGAVSQYMYGIRLNTLIVPGWQGYLNGYVAGIKCGDQTQLVVIKYLSTGNSILVDNETPCPGPDGNFSVQPSTTLTITYLRP